ncbi:hypothetical protein [Palaeococcus sp. (in: euryarchaeotes)]
MECMELFKDIGRFKYFVNLHRLTGGAMRIKDPTEDELIEALES